MDPINSMPRRLTCGVSLVLILAFSLMGCAHKGGAGQHLNTPPSIQTETGPDLIVEDDEFSGEDDFFEDEFNTDTTLVADPLAPINRVIYKFNDKLYFWCLKPIAKGYRAVVPEPVRLGVGNMIYNVAGIGRMANCLMQGKLKSAGGELGRFFINTTAGLLGLGNPAANFPALNPEREDFGQTLGSYGIGSGIYLVLPIFGPSSIRDAIGLVGDGYLNPLAYIDPWYVPVSLRALDLTNRLSFHIGDYEAVKGSALDPYILFRSVYMQKRRQMVEH